MTTSPKKTPAATKTTTAKAAAKTACAPLADKTPVPAKATRNQAGKATAAKKKTASAKAVRITEASPRALPSPAPSPAADASRSQPQRGKMGAVVALLERDAGVSLADLMAATGWQAHSVRGALSTLKKKLGRPLQSTTEADGQRVYRLGRA